MKVVIFVIIVLFITENFGKMRVVPEERYENCDESPTEGFFRSTNLTNLFNEFTLTEDNRIIVNSNASWKVPITLEEKLFVRISGDHWYLGRWQKRFIYTMLDGCKDLFNPVGITYPYLKDYKRCPYDENDVVTFSEKEFDLSYLVLPPNYIGRWKVYVEVKYTTEGGERLQDCHMIRGEVEMY